METRGAASLVIVVVTLLSTVAVVKRRPDLPLVVQLRRSSAFLSIVSGSVGGTSAAQREILDCRVTSVDVVFHEFPRVAVG